MPFKKGDPNINRNGRPPGSLSLVQLLKEKLLTIPEGAKLSYADGVIEALVKKAISDEDMSAIREVINRTDGMPSQPIEQSVNLSEKMIEIIKKYYE